MEPKLYFPIYGEDDKVTLVSLDPINAPIETTIEELDQMPAYLWNPESSGDAISAGERDVP